MRHSGNSLFTTRSVWLVYIGLVLVFRGCLLKSNGKYLFSRWVKSTAYLKDKIARGWAVFPPIFGRRARQRGQPCRLGLVTRCLIISRPATARGNSSHQSNIAAVVVHPLLFKLPKSSHLIQPSTPYLIQPVDPRIHDGIWLDRSVEGMARLRSKIPLVFHQNPTLHCLSTL